MENKDAVELAYNNGYEAGYEAATKEKDLVISYLEGYILGAKISRAVLYEESKKEKVKQDNLQV